MEREKQLILDILKSEHFENDFSIQDFKEVDQVSFYKWLVVHRMTGYVGIHMENLEGIKNERFMVKKLLKKDLGVIQQKVNIVSREVMPEICKVLNENEIPFVFLKGSITSLSLFEHVGERNYSDIDLLIAKKDLKKAKKALLENGFHQDLENDPKGVKATYFEMVTHQAYPFLLGDRVSVEPSFELDINFAYGPEPVLKNKQMVLDALERRTYFEYEGNQFPTLSNEDMLIFLAAHTWRDAVYIHKIKDNEDIKLYQYIELAKLVMEKVINYEQVEAIVKKYKLEEIVYYTLYHLNYLIPVTRSKTVSFMESIKPEDTSFVNKFGIENGAGWEWPIPFEERIFNTDKFDSIVEKYSMDTFADFLKRESIFGN